MGAGLGACEPLDSGLPRLPGLLKGGEIGMMGVLVSPPLGQERSELDLTIGRNWIWPFLFLGCCLIVWEIRRRLSSKDVER